ncbi:hypothetical protein Pcinc_004124 [Petrolisthes cinctipes]|uniref:Uncharacterized protein n=1 Tax=Petrolisthes cinctipes TaxID=88211 RepID=A0AAE1L0K2_PETCI|nr:hypothetical protein Pcinc_004124 [Petrolisthes cinctipes]
MQTGIKRLLFDQSAPSMAFAEWSVIARIICGEEMQARTQFSTSREMLCHTNFCVSSRVVARRQEWDRLWMRLKTCRRRDAIHERGRPVLISQRIVLTASPMDVSFH